MKKIIKRLIIGKPVEGEILPPPKVTSTYPKHRPSEIEWAKEFNFGSRYGHRGSFYQNRFVYLNNN